MSEKSCKIRVVKKATITTEPSVIPTNTKPTTCPKERSIQSIRESFLREVEANRRAQYENDRKIFAI